MDAITHQRHILNAGLLTIAIRHMDSLTSFAGHDNLNIYHQL